MRGFCCELESFKNDYFKKLNCSTFHSDFVFVLRHGSGSGIAISDNDRQIIVSSRTERSSLKDQLVSDGG